MNENKSEELKEDKKQRSNNNNEPKALNILDETTIV